MKSINLEEKTDYLKSHPEIISTDSKYPLYAYIPATKRDILRSAQNDFRDIFEEFIKYKKKKFKLSEYQIEAIEDDFYRFLSYCETLVNEKAVTNDLENDE